MVHAFAEEGCPRGRGPDRAHLCPQKAGQGAQASLGAWGQGAPSDVEVSPRDPEGPCLSQMIQSVEQLGPESRSDLTPCRLGLPVPSWVSAWAAGVGAGSSLQHPVQWRGCFLSRTLVVVCSGRSLSPQGQVAGKLTQHPGLLSHLLLGLSWVGNWGPRWWQGCSVAPAPSVTSRSHLSGPPSLILKGLRRPPEVEPGWWAAAVGTP